MTNLPRKLDESTGLPASRPFSCDEAADRPPSVAAWITDDLVAEHRRVWSRVCRRPVPIEEAMEIIMNIKNLAEAILGSLHGRAES